MVRVDVGGSEQLGAASRRLGRVAIGLRNGPREVARQAAPVIRGALRAEAPRGRVHKHPGPTLAESIGFRTIVTADGAVVTFQANWYARFVLGGTQPHEISAGIYSKRSPARALPLALGMRASVHHPGAHANDFRQRAVDAAESRLGLVLGDVGEGILRGDLASTSVRID